MSPSRKTKTTTTTKPTNENQVSFTASFVCTTKFDSAMLRILEIPEKYMNHVHLTSKLKEYEGSNYIYINNKKLNGMKLEMNRKLKVYLLFDEFTDKKGVYVLYIKQVLVKDKGELEARVFNSEINELSDSE
jgi:hypothetical protein